MLVSRASVWEEGKLPVVTVPLAGVRWTPWTVICQLCPKSSNAHNYWVLVVGKGNRLGHLRKEKLTVLYKGRRS